MLQSRAVAEPGDDNLPGSNGFTTALQTKRFLGRVSVGAIVSAVVASFLIGEDAHAQFERLMGGAGEPIGYLDSQGEKTFVKDRCFQTLGYTTRDGTFTDTGIRKARSPLPYMLLERQRNCSSRRTAN